MLEHTVGDLRGDAHRYRFDDRAPLGRQGSDPGTPPAQLPLGQRRGVRAEAVGGSGHDADTAVRAGARAGASAARRAAGSQDVIEVEDGGCGIAPEALAHIFDRFARADAARTRAHGGVGLGLAIVDAIAKAHGGRCTVRRAGKGTVFALRMPRFGELPRAVLRPPALAAKS
jgi:signal transduction histidine kinase